MNLYEISKKYKERFDNIVFDEETGEILGFANGEEIEGDFEEKTENTVLYLKDLSAMVAAIEAEEEALSKRRKQMTKKVEWLKGYLTFCLDMAGVERVETSKFRISFRKDSVVDITDRELLPDEYLRHKTSTEPDKKAIKKAIGEGIEVAGAQILEKRSIQIK